MGIVEGSHCRESGIGSESIIATTLSHISRNELYRKCACNLNGRKT